MNKDFFNARVTGILSFAPRNNRVIQIYLMVEYAEEDEIVENAVHLARTLKYEFDGVHMMSQDICDKALKYIPKEIRVSLEKDNYCNLEPKYITSIKKAFSRALYV